LHLSLEVTIEVRFISTSGFEAQLFGGDGARASHRSVKQWWYRYHKGC